MKMGSTSQLKLALAVYGLVSCAASAWAQSPPTPAASQLAAQATSSCQPYKGRKLSLVVPFKPGGGFDLLARAMEPILARHSGMAVSVYNVPGASGRLALVQILNGRPERPAIAIIGLGSFSSLLLEDKGAVSLSQFAGLGTASKDTAVWVVRAPIPWDSAGTRLYTGTSAGTNLARLELPSHVAGIQVRTLMGYQGTHDSWLALLRGEIDIAPMADQAAQRVLASGPDKAMVGLILDSKPHPEFPGVPHLAGRGGVVDRRSQRLPKAERQRLMDTADLAVTLAQSSKSLVASATLSPPVLACLRQATQATLFDPELAAMASRQQLELAPDSAAATQIKMQQLDKILQQNLPLLRAVAAGKNEGR